MSRVPVRLIAVFFSASALCASARCQEWTRTLFEPAEAQIFASDGLPQTDPKPRSGSSTAAIASRSRPITDKERLDYLPRDSFTSPRALIGPAITAVLTHAYDDPPE